MLGVDFFGFSGRIKLEALSFVLSEISPMIENSVRKKLFKITGIWAIHQAASALPPIYDRVLYHYHNVR